MPHGVLGEFMGTLVLILLGNGVVANVLLKKSKGESGGWIVITAGWAMAVMCGVFTAVALGGDGHLNPAVTVAAGISTGDFSNLLGYSVAQLAGAFVGACLVWLHYLPHWRETPEADLKFACFATSPAIRSIGANLISEVIGTFVLVLVADAIGSKAVAANGVAPGVGPWLVGGLIWAIGLGLGGTTGYAINPARDLGPRIAHAFLPIPGKSGSDWGYAAVPIVGPVIGAILAALLARAAHL
ncbi:MAG TPA: MIP/aquaporin family protein [Bryobacteraceae bacterium]|nr:MIP/aquaporin family protein [Bryobacteraceae bacterium]